jgi:ribosomal protein S18 acetylase RimI-like enzyme
LTEYGVVERLPTVDELIDLRARTGLSPKSREAATRGLAGTLFGAVVTADGQTIGMGRVVGDGGTAYQIVDIAVLPEHQGRGLGKRIMATLVGWLQREAPATAYVSLIADGPAKHLYAQFGFAEVTPESVGMAMLIGESIGTSR